MDFARLVPNPYEGMTEEEATEYEARVIAKRAEEDARDERDRVAELRRDLLEHGCPRKDLDRVLGGDMAPTMPLESAKRAVLAEDALTVLSGPPGTGKTTAAAWWLLAKRGPVRDMRCEVARFVDAATLARWPRYDETRMRQVTRARALVIDDLGVEYDDKSGAFRSLFDELVNSRYAADLPTLITTNLDAKAFKARYGERVADRIRERGRFEVVNGKSLRGNR